MSVVYSAQHSEADPRRQTHPRLGRGPRENAPPAPWRGFTAAVRHAGDMLLWVYPHGPLSDVIEYAVEVEADHGGVRIMVARDERSVPHAIAVSVGDDPADFADALTMWGLASLDDSNEPPPEWFG